MQFALAHGRHLGPAGARRHLLGAELLAAPGTDDEVGRAARGLQRVGNHAVAAHGLQRQFGKDIVPARHRDQLRHPADGADHGLVPLLEVHARPARPGTGRLRDLRMSRLALRNPGLGAFLLAHQARHQAQGLEDLGHAALVGHQYVQARADQFVGQRGLHVGKADHQVRLQRRDAVDLAVQERADARLLLPRARRAHGVAADAHDALLLPQQVQPLGGLFGEADDALGVGVGHPRDCGGPRWPVGH